MNITCKHCGGKHSLFWYQGASVRKLCYTCNKYQTRLQNRNTGYTEVRHITKRLIYSEQTTDKELEGIPTVYSKPVLKKESDAHQKNLKL
jgi:hypothetical protein